MRTKNLEEPMEDAISDERFAQFVERARSSMSAKPADELAAGHLSAIVVAASDPTLVNAPFRPKLARKRSRRLAAKLAAATAGALMALGGLAYAGVLPQKLQDALSDAAGKAGFTVPASQEHRQDLANHQANSGSNGKSVSGDVHKVLNDTTLTGRDKGDAVSNVASQNRENDSHPTSTASPQSHDSSESQSHKDQPKKP
ncbi:MAG: hypothetical protein ABR507_07670 [Actinomycetota bacterium]